MGSIKAHGVHGLPALFFQKYWHVVGEEVSALVLDILNNKKSLADINHILIALIPKVKASKNFSQFHPIHLCNVIIKIVTKTKANYLKLMLFDFINETQSAFVP